MHLNGENWVNGLNVYDSEKNGPQGQVCPHPGGNIHVYITMIFKDLFL